MQLRELKNICMGQQNRMVEEVWSRHNNTIILPKYNVGKENSSITCRGLRTRISTAESGQLQYWVLPVIVPTA